MHESPVGKKMSFACSGKVETQGVTVLWLSLVTYVQRTIKINDEENPTDAMFLVAIEKVSYNPTCKLQLKNLSYNLTTSSV
jgi:hypothetical protein